MLILLILPSTLSCEPPLTVLISATYEKAYMIRACSDYPLYGIKHRNFTGLSPVLQN